MSCHHHESPKAAPLDVNARRVARVASIVTAAGPHTHIGVYAIGVFDSTPLIDMRGDERFVPASTLKMLTAAAALYYLGPEFRFNTQVLVDEISHNGKVAKNLYLRGSGDPSLTDASLQSLAQAVKQQGITSVTGDIIVDDSIFDPTPWGKGWMWDDLDSGFAAPVLGVNVGHNQLAVTALPAARPGLPAHLSYTPATSLVNMHNTVTTTRAGGPTSIKAVVTDLDPLGVGVGQDILFAGSIPLNGGAWTKQLAVRDGALFAGGLLKEHLHDSHIDITGVVRRGLTTATAFPIGGHASRQLSEALLDFVKVSNNHGMESLLKRIGTNTSLQPGSWQNGAAAVKAFLAQQVGMDVSTIGVTDGSGNSRYNLITPRQMTQLLRYMYRNFLANAEFMASLPLGGVDGTLVHRFVNPALHGRVRAKTGTMTGVTNLAGYVITDRDEVLAFSIMVENFTGGPDRYRRLQEEVLQAIVQTTERKETP